MTTIQSTTATTNTDPVLPPPPKQMLGQDDFLRLMIAQMKNQDPTKPLEGQEYLGQLAQFSTLNSIQELQKSFDDLAKFLRSVHTTQATSLVGKQVLVDGDQGYYTPGQSVQGQVLVPDSVSNLAVKVYGANGQLVDTMNMGPQATGRVGFSWGGAGATGEGVYRITAEASIDGQAQQLSTLVWNPVQSVAVGQNGQNASLRLAGLGNVDMNTVREIR